MISNKILQSNSPPTKAHLTMKQLRLLLFVVLIFSCDDKGDTIEEEFIAPIIVPNGSEQYLNLSSDFIFDQNELRTFELKLSEKNLSKIDNDPTAEQYVEGMMIFEGDTTVSYTHLTLPTILRV